MPDYIITSHAYIHSRNPRGFSRHWLWNMRVRQVQWKNAMQVRKAMPELLRLVATRFPFAQVLVASRGRLSFRFDDLTITEAAADLLRTATEPYRYLRVFHYQNEVDVRIVPFTKGLALSELSRQLPVSREQVLVIGDGYNDASMMDEEVAAHTGCPMNAEPEVAEIVHRRGGHIATKRALAGVLEIFDAYSKGAVCSDLPSGWQDPELTPNPMRARNHSGRGFSMKSALRGLLLFLAALYTALFVFAFFGILPGAMAGPFLRPWNALLSLVRMAFPDSFAF